MIPRLLSKRPLLPIPNIPTCGDRPLTQLLEFIHDAPGYLRTLAIRHGPLVQLNVSRGRVVFVSGAAPTLQVLADERHFGKGFHQSMGHAWKEEVPLRSILGDGLLTSRGSDHRRQRRLLRPAFARERLPAYADIVHHEVDTVTSGWTNGAAVDLADVFASITLRVMARSLLGVPLSAADTDRIKGVLKRLMEGLVLDATTMLLLKRVGRLRVDRRRRVLDELDDVVVQAVERISLDEQDADTALHRLVRANGGRATEGSLATPEVRSQIRTLLVTGFETVTTALTWVYHLLSLHPDIEGHLYERVRDAGVVRLDASCPVMQPTDFVNAVVAEALRLFPPIWLLVRQAQDDAVLAGTRIPGGTTLLVSPYVVQRDPAIWTDPDRFLPQRWLKFDGSEDQRLWTTAPGSYYPFGGGARVCIGADFAFYEIGLIVERISRSWRLVAARSATLPTRASVTLRPRGDLSYVTIRR
ncbi:cytochrome P450 [Micromonospora lupini]|nr:cytochrome P450 [Micromonospora lupini]